METGRLRESKRITSVAERSRANIVAPWHVKRSLLESAPRFTLHMCIIILRLLYQLRCNPSFDDRVRNISSESKLPAPHVLGLTVSNDVNNDDDAIATSLRFVVECCQS